MAATVAGCTTSLLAASASCTGCNLLQCHPLSRGHLFLQLPPGPAAAGRSLAKTSRTSAQLRLRTSKKLRAATTGFSAESAAANSLWLQWQRRCSQLSL